jgi:hypothetical protein
MKEIKIYYYYYYYILVPNAFDDEFLGLRMINFSNHAYGPPVMKLLSITYSDNYN